MNNRNINPLHKAREYAFLLLKFRPRSEKEIYQRLKKKKFDDEIIRKTLAFLKDKDFINDAKFSRVWIESRLKRPLGLRRIREELRLKGIDKEIINSQTEEIKNNYSEGGIVAGIIRERLKRLKGIEPLKRKQRIFSYLLRRGFSAEVIRDVINQLTLTTYEVE